MSHDYKVGDLVTYGPTVNGATLKGRVVKVEAGTVYFKITGTGGGDVWPKGFVWDTPASTPWMSKREATK